MWKNLLNIKNIKSHTYNFKNKIQTYKHLVIKIIISIQKHKHFIRFSDTLYLKKIILFLMFW